MQRLMGSYSRDDDRGHHRGGYDPYGYDGGYYDQQVILLVFLFLNKNCFLKLVFQLNVTRKSY